MLHVRFIFNSGQIQLRTSFSLPEGVVLWELPLYYNFRIFSYFLTNFRLTTHSRTSPTTQLKWPLPNKRSLIQNTKYYPVKALVVGFSCKRTHPHPVSNRDHFLRWQSLRTFHDAWSVLCVPCMSCATRGIRGTNFRNKTDLFIVYHNLKIACRTFTPKK